MYKSVTLLYKIVANASLGFVYFGYSVGYLNPALTTVDVVFGITENVDYYNGLLSAVLTIGAAVGVLLMPYILNMVSRRVALIILDAFGILGYGIQLAGNWNCLVLGRFLAGVVLGLNSALVPVYVNEFSPPELQGVLGSIMTMSGSSGLFLSFFIGLWYGQTPTTEDQYWKVGFAFPLLICGFRTFNLLYNFKLDSPTYYLSINDNEQAIESIKFIYQDQYISDVLQAGRQNAKSNQQQEKETYSDLLNGRLFKNFLRISILSIIGQLLGINAVIFYSTSIFNEITGNDVKMSNFLNLFVPLLGILGAYVMGLFIGKMSRKNFFLFGALASVISEIPLAIMTSFEVQPAILIVLFIFLFIFLFSATIGPGFWVVLPEMVSPKGVCLATSINWLATAVVGQVFPMLVTAFSISTCFYIFSFSGILGCLYIYYEFNPDKKTEVSEIQTELRILEK